MTNSGEVLIELQRSWFSLKCVMVLWYENQTYITYKITSLTLKEVEHRYYTGYEGSTKSLRTKNIQTS